MSNFLPRILAYCGLAVCAAVIFAIVGGGGCDERPSQQIAPRRLRVFATVYAIGDLARQIGGKYVEVEFAMESGQLLAEFEPSDSLRAKMNACDLVIANGTSDAWAVSDSKNPYAQQRVIRLDALARKAGQNPTGLLWLDPVIAQQACDEIATRYSILAPEHEVYFRGQAKNLKDQIEALVAEYREKFKRAQRRRVMALSSDFDALAAQLDVDVVHVPSATVDVLSESQIRQLHQASLEEHIVTLLVRSDTPRGLIQDLAQRTGFRLVTLDPYGSSAGTGRDSYLSVLRYDLDQLLDAVDAHK